MDPKYWQIIHYPSAEKDRDHFWDNVWPNVAAKDDESTSYNTSIILANHSVSNTTHCELIDSLAD